MAQGKLYATCHKQESRHTKYLKTLSKYSMLVHFEARSTKRTVIFSNNNAVILFDTLLAEFIENAICMKTKDQLFQRESVILRSRVVLKTNSQGGSHDLLVQEARSSWESQEDAESYGETPSNTADYRIPAKSISTVKLQDARRQKQRHKADRDVRETAKSTSPTTENGYENCIYSMNNIHMSNEDIKHDTNYINKHKYTNTDMRKLHL